MGKKAFKAILVIFIVMLFKCTTVNASTAEDLYKMYNIKFETKYPEDVLNTIRKYDNAKKYLSMYKYVASSEYDESIVSKRINELECEKSTIEDRLLAGYNLSISEIYDLEDRYVTVCKHLNDAKKTIESYDVDFTRPEPEDVPTYSEYLEAKKIKSSIDTKMNIGDIVNIKPTNVAYLLESSTENSMTIKVASGTTVTSLFNGEVVMINGSGITIDHYNGIYTFYGDVDETYVNIGDTVYQGQALGTVDDFLTLKCKVGNKIVNINKLFEKE